MKIRGQTVYSLDERLLRMSVADPKTGCWNWRGATHNGYGRLRVGSRQVGRRTVSAHRLAYEVFIGPIPQGREVCHSCDNRACINPAHLFAGTHQDNIDDRERKGRNNHVVGSKIGTAKLSDSIVHELRALRAAGLSFGKLATRFGVDKKTVQDAVSGKYWSHVSLPAPPSTEDAKKDCGATE